MAKRDAAHFLARAERERALAAQAVTDWARKAHLKTADELEDRARKMGGRSRDTPSPPVRPRT